MGFYKSNIEVGQNNLTSINKQLCERKSCNQFKLNKISELSKQANKQTNISTITFAEHPIHIKFQFDGGMIYDAEPMLKQIINFHN